MTTAATSLTEILIPRATTAASVTSALGQLTLTTPFAALLAEGNFVQAPGMVPTESGGVSDLAALLSMGEAGTVVESEGGPAEPAYNVIALFDSTALSTPANRIPGLNLGETTQIPDDASSDGSIAAPIGDEHATPVTTDFPRPLPVHTDSGHAELIQAHTDNPNRDHPLSPQPVQKGFTAADVMAEIAHFHPTGKESIADAGEAVPVTPGGMRDSTVAPVTAALSAASTALSPAARNTATPANDGQAARQGEAPDPRVTSQIAQSVIPRPAPQSVVPRLAPQAGAIVEQAAAKPTTGLSSALSGDVALAAMAVETPKPSVARPTAKPTPAAGQSASETVAGLNANANGIQPSSQAASQPASQPSSQHPLSHRQSQSPTGQAHPIPATSGKFLEQASFGVDSRQAIAEAIDQQAAPRTAIDARIDSLQPAPQTLRAGETAAQPNRPLALPTAPPAPPAEQVAMQLRHAVQL